MSTYSVDPIYVHTFNAWLDYTTWNEYLGAFRKATGLIPIDREMLEIGLLSCQDVAVPHHTPFLQHAVKRYYCDAQRRSFMVLEGDDCSNYEADERVRQLNSCGLAWVFIGMLSMSSKCCYLLTHTKHKDALEDIARKADFK